MLRFLLFNKYIHSLYLFLEILYNNYYIIRIEFPAVKYRIFYNYPLVGLKFIQNFTQAISDRAYSWNLGSNPGIQTHDHWIKGQDATNQPQRPAILKKSDNYCSYCGKKNFIYTYTQNFKI